MLRKAWFSSLLVWVSLGLLLQAQTCERGDTFLLSLSLVVDGEEQIQGFNINNRSGYSVTTTGTTGTLTVQTRMDDSTATYQWIVDGTTIEANNIGLGGGTVQVTIPDGQSRLFIGVRAAKGNADGYWVDVERTGPLPFPCTEQGILDAIAAGGGPHTFDCAGPTTVALTAPLSITADVILDGGGNLEIASSFGDALRVDAPANLEILQLRIQGEIRNEVGGGLVLEDSQVVGSLVIVHGAGDVVIRRSAVTPIDDAGGFVWLLNDVGLGGAGTVDISDSLFVGVANFQQGLQGLSVIAGQVRIANSTFVGDLRTGLEVLANTMSGFHMTVFGLSMQGVDPGVFSLGSNLILPDNAGNMSCLQLEANVSSVGYNVEVGGDTCSFNDPTDQVNVTPAQLNLGPLEDNGGPTDTFLPGPGSIAIDAIPVADCLDADGLPLVTDQRGIARPQGTACDIGAVEVDQP